MSGFVAFIVACSWDILLLLLILLPLINMALSLDLMFTCFLAGVKGSFYIAQYPVRWTAQSASHFLPSLTDLFIPTPFSASPG